MLRTLILCGIIFFCGRTGLLAQENPEREIRVVLADQTNCWNKGDLECFMKGYWESDSLKFVGKSGVTYGWGQTLENYKKGYPNTDAMGKLSFEVISLDPVESMYYFVVGKWYLQRTIGDIGGHFTLLFKKIDNNWVIIADHSS